MAEHEPAKRMKAWAPIDSRGEIVWTLMREHRSLVDDAVKRFNRFVTNKTRPWRVGRIEVRELTAPKPRAKRDKVGRAAKPN